SGPPWISARGRSDWRTGLEWAKGVTGFRSRREDRSAPLRYLSQTSAGKMFALPKVEVGLQVLERQLAHGKKYLLGADLTLADFYLVPCTFSFSLTEEGKAMYPKYPGFCRWRETMEALPTVQRFRASLPPRAPIEHAREWAVSHRPKY